MVKAEEQRAFNVIFEAARMSGKLKPGVVYETGFLPRALKRF